MSPEMPHGIELGGTQEKEVFNNAPIINNSETESPFENFDIVAKNAVMSGKIIDRKEMSESSILFQQNIIKSIMLDKRPVAVKKIWDEYQELVNGYVKELSTDKEKTEARSYFNSLERSIRGSAATISFFEDQGLNTRFSTIKEDGYKKCDLFFESNSKKKKKFCLAVQIKSHHIPAMDKKGIAEVVNSLILTDEERLTGKDQKDFRILTDYCVMRSKEAGNNYYPIFVNMPVSQEIKDEERRRINIIQLVDSCGKINEVLGRSLGAKWVEKKKMLGIDK